MTETISMSFDTDFVLDYVAEQIAWLFGPYEPIYHRTVRRLSDSARGDPEAIRRHLLYLERLLFKVEVDRSYDRLIAVESLDDWKWLTYDENVDVIPIYDDAVSVTATRLIAKPSEIPNVLRLVIGVPGTANGVDVENHNFGYHFHYGRVKRDKFHRTNLLLTFNPLDHNPNSSPKPKITLYSEKHGSGDPIDVQTIGNNKRRPIYDVCYSEMVSRGLNSFRKPTKKCTTFYP